MVPFLPTPTRTSLAIEEVLGYRPTRKGPNWTLFADSCVKAFRTRARDLSIISNVPTAFVSLFRVGGRSYTSSVNKGDLTVQVAGICLNGEDSKFDLSSLVGVLREAVGTGEIVPVGGVNQGMDEEEYWRVHPPRRLVAERCLDVGWSASRTILVRAENAPVRGEPASVEFDAAWVLDREESKGDIVGFFHTHPNGSPNPKPAGLRRPSGLGPARFGKPLLCLIDSDGELAAYRFDDDESNGDRIMACELLPRGIVVAFDDDGSERWRISSS